MTLYFDYRVNVGDLGPRTVFTHVDWHEQHPLLAVATVCEEKGGAVYICDDLGEKLKNIEPLTHPSSEVTHLSWHPNRRTLVITWRNGEIRIWNGDNEYILVQTTKQTVIKEAKWSHQGSKFLTIDSNGEIGGWRLDARSHLVNLFLVKPPSGVPLHLEMRATKSNIDLAGLAKKAVAGDERALDMFSAWRPKTAGRRTALQTDTTSFYVSTSTDCVYYVNETGFMKEVLKLMANIKKMMHHETEDYLLVMVEGWNMYYYSVDHSGNLQELTQVKLSTSSVASYSSVVWCGSGTLACAVGDITIRIWEPITGDSYSLIFSRSDQTSKETITNLSFSKQKGLLCGCTDSGSVIIWKVTGKGYDAWTQTASTKLKHSVKDSFWGVNHLAINTETTVYILREHQLSALYHNQILVIQTSASQMLVSVGEESVELNTDIQVCGIALNDQIAAAWSGKVVVVYQLVPISSINVVGSFACECLSVGIWDQNLVVLSVSGKIEILTLQGTVKQLVKTDGQPITLSLTQHYMTISTINGVLQVWDLSRREARPHSKMKDLIEGIADFSEVISAVCNSDGSKVALTVAGSNLTPLPAVFVWIIEENNIYSYYFVSASEPSRFILNMHWDPEEPRLLVCEARRPISTSNSKRFPSTSSSVLRHSEVSPITVLVSFLCSTNQGLLLKETMPMDPDFISLLGIDLPHCIIIQKSSQQKISGKRLLMKDFEGLENCDVSTKKAVVNFSFSLSAGDIDQAFRSIRTVKSFAVWTTLAKMCVKFKRLDVAKICLGRMGCLRGIIALKEAEKEPELDSRVAALALQLGMIPEAEQLYIDCRRMDLLNKVHQMCDHWDKSVEIAQKHDRIHLKNTYHNYGRYLESSGDTEGAAYMYERADTFKHEVPRMLLGNLNALEKYITEKKNPVLLKWWAQFKEMKGDKRVAMKFYEEAEDYMSLVRMLCHAGDVERAAQIAESTGNSAACYYLAGRYEAMGILPTAVHFYSRATAYTNAIRLCKDQGLEDQLWALALSAGPREQAEAGKYLELISPDKAVLLYHKAGLFHKALDLAFKHNQYEAVELIASELTSEDDKELLVKCADYFVEQNHFEKAVHLLAIAKQYETAITIAWDHNVLLNDDLAEKLTPDEGYANRNQLLEKIADCSLAQANYHLATKKYTQSGNKMKAMKSLLKSGDTEKIIFFANVTRQKEMYILAANYLQSLDWRVKPELLKNIIGFYTKGKAPHLLANFYVACAQVEVDDFRNYHKALGALTEAAKTLNGPWGEQYGSLKETINRKMAVVNKFLDASRHFERGEGQSGMENCRSLLNSDCEAIRKGDIYALMIENTVKNNDLASARTLLLELQHAQPGDNIEYYLTKDILLRLGIETDAFADVQVASTQNEEDVFDETI